MKTKSLFAKRLVVLAMAVSFVSTFVPLASAATPCCNITKIDARTGVVTAQDRSTGRTFQFTASPAVLQKVKVGQGVYANFKTRQLSLDGKIACCNIVNVAVAPTTTPGSLGGARAGTQIAPVDDARTKGTQALPPNDARVTGTQISPPNDAKIGGSQAIPPEGVTVTGTQVSPPNGAKVGGSQVTPPVGSQITPPNDSRVSGNQILPVDGAKVDGSQITPPNGARVGSSQVSPPPCCQITSIGKSGVITAIDKTTGHSFQFTASPSVQQSLKVGQGVYANFKTHQLSLDGKIACCNIVNVGAAPTNNLNPNEASLPACKQHHPGRQNRLESVAKAGDAHMAMSAAGHATLYAIQRFHLESLNFSQDDISRAQKDVYEFLKWKLGSPSAIAAQFIAAGYQHFDRSYSDEAAAALLGTDLPSEAHGSKVTFSVDFTQHLKMKADQLQGASAAAVAVMLETEFGPLGAIGFEIANQLVSNGVDVAIPRVDFDMPKSWDIANSLVNSMIVVKMSPEQPAQNDNVALRPAAKH